LAGDPFFVFISGRTCKVFNVAITSAKVRDKSRFRPVAGFSAFPVICTRSPLGGVFKPAGTGSRQGENVGKAGNGWCRLKGVLRQSLL
jgi:hypothetical protein